MAETDEDLIRLHGDHGKWSIALWREEAAAGETDMEYVDWRADKLWCEAQDGPGIDIDDDGYSDVDGLPQ